MALFKRVFICYACKPMTVPAVLDKLTDGVVVVTCPKCSANELWGEENILPTLEHFNYIDDKIAEC